MASLPVSGCFDASYDRFEDYPLNIIYRTTYQRTLEYLKENLRKRSDRLCAEEKYLDIGCRDFDSRYGKNVRYIQDMEELEIRLRNRYPAELNAGLIGQTLGRESDPDCRFISFWATHSRAKLKVNRTALLKILSFHQVNPTYLELLSTFGQQSDAHEISYSTFRARNFLVECYHGCTDQGAAASHAAGMGASDHIQAPCQDSPAVPELGRSGNRYQMSWNLRTVINKFALDNKLQEGVAVDPPWSIQCGAFYHEFDVANGRSFWITTSAREDIQHRLRDLTDKSSKPSELRFNIPDVSFRFSLKVHLLFSQWSAEGWVEYLDYLEQLVKQQTDMAVAADRNINNHRIEYTSNDLQRIQAREDEAHNADVALEGNAEIMTSLKTFYLALLNEPQFFLQDICRQDLISFVAQVGELVANSKRQSTRAKALVKRTRSRKELVVQHLQSQIAEETKILAKEAQKETVAMRVIAVLTVFYLPATFVSTFFGTDIVKYRDGNEREESKASVSRLAMLSWLEISLPLTFITLSLAAMWYFWANKRMKESSV